MTALEKVLKCYIMTDCHDNDCKTCPYRQYEYESIFDAVKAIDEKIKALEKSNKNWRRKCQRLRKKLKEVS